jgi:hypothetical protein
MGQETLRRTGAWQSSKRSSASRLNRQTDVSEQVECIREMQQYMERFPTRSQPTR